MFKKIKYDNLLNSSQWASHFISTRSMVNTYKRLNKEHQAAIQRETYEINTKCWCRMSNDTIALISELFNSTASDHGTMLHSMKSITRFYVALLNHNDYVNEIGAYEFSI